MTMSKEPQEFKSHSFGDHEVEEYYNTPVPTFLKWVYALLPFWGIFWWVMYSDGSQGWLDRGYWQDLERAANTTKSVEMSYQKPTERQRVAMKD